MNIPLHTLVHCTDGPFGHTTCLIVNPINNVVTHFVVNNRRVLGHEHVVPVSFITSVTEDEIVLNCDRASLVHLPDFFEYRYDRLDDVIPSREDHIYWPMVVLEDEPQELSPKPPQIPIAELGIQRGMAVYTAAENEDGERTDHSYFGQVVAFVADSQTGGVTHLVVRKGYLCGAERRDTVIPTSDILKHDSEKVELRLTKQEIEDMPLSRVKPLFLPDH
jgi:hypothetical protein